MLEKHLLSVCLSAALSASAALEPIDFVDPMIGTAATGNTTPSALWPFGQVQPAPDTTWQDDDSYHGLECGYSHGHEWLLYFTQTHLSGTGCSDLQDIGIRPAVKDRRFKGSQRASAGYYTCTVGGVKCEVTASPHVAYYRFSAETNITLEVNFGAGPKNGKHIRSSVSCTEGAHKLVGSNVVDRWLRGRHVYAAIECSVPFVSAKQDGMRWTLAFDAKTVEVRIAISRNSVDAANRTLAKDGPSLAFEPRKEACRNAWREILSRAEIEAGEGTKKVWYTAIYHACFQPNLISDAEEPDIYSTFSTWDTYRAAHPLYTILCPERVPDFVRSLLRHHQRYGKLSVWELWGEDVHCMPGIHSIPPLYEACVKGLTGGISEAEIFKAIDDTLYKRGGGDLAGIMENCYDDWCAAELAKRVGNAEREKYYRARANVWTNFYDASTGYIRGKAEGGRWVTPFDPFDRFANGYCEGSAAHWSWHVMQDPALLISLHGGKEKAFADLEKIFTAPENFPGQKPRYECTGPIGQHAHGNEHCQHMPYFYALVGRPDRTEEIVQEICRRHYRATPDGICGNEDCGQMSAWYLLSASGFYPFNPASGEYVLGAPQVSKVTWRLPNGKTFVVRAKGLYGNNKYVQNVTLNDLTLGGAILRHEDIAAGGELVFEMGLKPPANRPVHTRFFIKADHPDSVYRVGEETVFTVTCFEPDGTLVKTGMNVRVVLNNFGGVKYLDRTVDTAKEGNPFKVRGTSPVPGSLKIEVSPAGATWSRNWSVVYDPEEIRQARPCPDDFDAFWREARAKYDREIPASGVKATRVPEKSNEKRDFYEIEIPFYGGKSYYAYMTIPKDRGPGPFPLRVSVPGAGPGSTWVWPFSPEFVNVTMNVHPWKIPDDAKTAAEHREQAEAELTKKYGKTSFGYYSQFGLSESREAGYYYGAILTAARALDWLVAHPAVDRSRVVYRGGSQGGAFGLFLAGLTPHVTDLRIDVPAMTDLNGCELKRACGWPFLTCGQATKEQNAVAARNAPYYDACNFAARCHAKRVRFSVGLVDFTCAPTCVLSAYNNIPAQDKVIFYGAGMPHWPTFDDTIRAFWESADRKAERTE